MSTNKELVEVLKQLVTELRNANKANEDRLKMEKALIAQQQQQQFVAGKRGKK
tara:strand:+ start:503 stop:661 length:159 start_codon:yes stop_codon:yes gene_type:complete